MERVIYSVIFYAKKAKRKKNGNLPVYGRITIDGKRAEFVVQSEITEEKWDFNRGCAKGSTKEAMKINDYLELVKTQIRDVKVFMEEKKMRVTAEELKNHYLGVFNNTLTFLKFFDEHNEKSKSLINIDLTKGTVERYYITRKHLSEFIKSKYNKSDLEFDDISPMFISNFEVYLKVTRSCCNNTVIKYMKVVKKVIRIALNNGYLKKDPFVNVKFRWDDVDLAYLNEKELDVLMNKEFSIERIQQVKDIYLFCCFTGLAFIDVKQLTTDEIVEKNGKLWIEKKRQKTKNLCSIPMLRPALDIMNKYTQNKECIKNGLVLPVSSNQKMNAYLKEIADMCGIKKSLSTHTARHTFATTVTLTNQVSMEVVSKMLGHSSINMTKRYARVVDDLVNKDMEKVFAIYQ